MSGTSTDRTPFFQKYFLKLYAEVVPQKSIGKITNNDNIENDREQLIVIIIIIIIIIITHSVHISDRRELLCCIENIHDLIAIIIVPIALRLPLLFGIYPLKVVQRRLTVFIAKRQRFRSTARSMTFLRFVCPRNGARFGGEPSRRRGHAVHLGLVRLCGADRVRTVNSAHIFTEFERKQLVLEQTRSLSL